MITTATRLRRLVLVLYGCAIPVLLWCYFVIPAPERWIFVDRAMKSWTFLMHGHY